MLVYFYFCRMYIVDMCILYLVQHCLNTIVRITVELCTMLCYMLCLKQGKTMHINIKFHFDSISYLRYINFVKFQVVALFVYVCVCISDSYN